MGNSEVGHMNLGAGRVVYQDLVKITKAIQDKSIQQNKVLQKAFSYAFKGRKKLHFLGLISDGGVHSHLDHLEALMEMATRFNLTDIFVHGFTDGRDVDPRSGYSYVETLEKKNLNIQVESWPLLLGGIMQWTEIKGGSELK